MIQIHRVYDFETAPKGRRFLVDRLWPRGLTKEKLAGVEWLRDISPTNELRKWYEHDPAKWPEFQKRYFAELDQQPEALRPLVDAARKGPVVLLYSSKETEINNAAALKIYLENKLKS